MLDFYSEATVCGVLKNFAIFTGKHLCRSLILKKLQTWRATTCIYIVYTFLSIYLFILSCLCIYVSLFFVCFTFFDFIKKRLLHRCFPVNIEYSFFYRPPSVAAPFHSTEAICYSNSCTGLDWQSVLTRASFTKKNLNDLFVVFYSTYFTIVKWILNDTIWLLRWRETQNALQLPVFFSFFCQPCPEPWSRGLAKLLSKLKTSLLPKCLMSIRLGRMVTNLKELLPTRLLYSLIACSWEITWYTKSISTTTILVTTERGWDVTYREGIPPIKSHMALQSRVYLKNHMTN